MINFISKLLIALALVAVGYGVYNLYTKPAEPQISTVGSNIETIKNYKLASPEKKLLTSTIKVDGQVVPMKEIEISSEVPGNIEKLTVSEGDYARKGQVLVVIEHSELDAAVKQAKARLAQAQAELKKAKAGARKEDIEIAKRAFNEAKISVDSATTNLSNGLKTAIDVADTNMDTVDKYFNDEDIPEDLQFNVHYIPEEDVSDFESKRKMLADLKTNASNIKDILNTHGEGNDLSADDVHKYADEIKTYLSSMKILVDKMKDSATDALDKHSSDPRLKELQADMKTIRVPIETQKQTIDSLVSALDLANAKYDKALASYTKVLAGTRKEDIEALQANVDLAKSAVVAAQAKLDKTIIKAPVSGKVSIVNKEEGEFVNSHETILTIITNGVYVKARIPERDMPNISVGQQVQISFDSYKGHVFDGEVYFIYPSEKVIKGKSSSYRYNKRVRYKAGNVCDC